MINLQTAPLPDLGVCWREGEERYIRSKGRWMGRRMNVGWNVPQNKAGSFLEVGPRNASTAYHFMHDLAPRLKSRIQLTTDGLKNLINPKLDKGKM